MTIVQTEDVLLYVPDGYSLGSPNPPPEQAGTSNDTITASDDAPDETAPSLPLSASAVSYIVKLSLSLPLSKADFDAEKQAKFKESIARAAGAPPADVEIDNIEALSSARRRLLASGIRIDVSVKAKDKAAADVMSAGLTTGNINAELSKVSKVLSLASQHAFASMLESVCIRNFDPHLVRAPTAGAAD